MLGEVNCSSDCRGALNSLIPAVGSQGTFFFIPWVWMKVQISKIVECRYRYSTCILMLQVDLSECLSVISKSAKVLLASVVRLMKKGMELYELGIVFLFKGVSRCVYNLVMVCCLHLGSGFFKAIYAFASNFPVEFCDE